MSTQVGPAGDAARLVDDAGHVVGLYDGDRQIGFCRAVTDAGSRLAGRQLGGAPRGRVKPDNHDPSGEISDRGQDADTVVAADLMPGDPKGRRYTAAYVPDTGEPIKDLGVGYAKHDFQS